MRGRHALVLGVAFFSVVAAQPAWLDGPAEVRTGETFPIGTQVAARPLVHVAPVPRDAPPLPDFSEVHVHAPRPGWLDVHAPPGTTIVNVTDGDGVDVPQKRSGDVVRALFVRAGAFDVAVTRADGTRDVVAIEVPADDTERRVLPPRRVAADVRLVVARLSPDVVTESDGGAFTLTVLRFDDGVWSPLPRARVTVAVERTGGAGFVAEADFEAVAADTFRGRLPVPAGTFDLRVNVTGTDVAGTSMLLTTRGRPVGSGDAAAVTGKAGDWTAHARALESGRVEVIGHAGADHAGFRVNVTQRGAPWLLVAPGHVAAPGALEGNVTLRDDRGDPLSPRADAVVTVTPDVPGFAVAVTADGWRFTGDFARGAYIFQAADGDWQARGDFRVGAADEGGDSPGDQEQVSTPRRAWWGHPVVAGVLVAAGVAAIAWALYGGRRMRAPPP